VAKNPYDDRRSQAIVTVNSTFILQEFKRNVGKHFYGDKELEKLTRKLILELWRRNPALLENIANMTAQKYGDYLKKEYGSVNFRKKLIKEMNQRKAAKIKQETEQHMEEIKEGILSEENVKLLLNDTIFDNSSILENKE